jgi:DNA-binding IclR family transcriptional regulator
MIKIFARIGSRGPIHCTGAGKAMLADYTDREFDRFYNIKAPLQSYTVNTMVDPQKLKEEMLLIRHNGYALDNGELEDGVRCVAVPVRNFENKVIAAVSVSGPDTRLTDDFIHDSLIPEVQAASAKISERLGFRSR